MRALILSAGLGERLRPLTLRMAKPAIPFLNVPMLGFPYHWLSTMHLSDVVFNTHYLPDSVQLAARKITNSATKVHFTFEPKILGSGGGIWNARKYLDGDEDFWIANGDAVALLEDPLTLEHMLDAHRRQKALATLLVCPLEGVGTVIPGVWMNAQGEVSAFGKKARTMDSVCYHYASFMVLNRRIWDALPPGESNIIYDVLEPNLLRGERVLGYRVDNMRWFETGNVRDYLAATMTCLKHMAQPEDRLGLAARAVVDRFAPDWRKHSDLKQGRLIADSATLAATAGISGFLVAGENVVVEENVRLNDCVLLPETRVRSGQTASNDVL